MKRGLPAVSQHGERTRITEGHGEEQYCASREAPEDSGAGSAARRPPPSETSVALRGSRSSSVLKISRCSRHDRRTVVHRSHPQAVRQTPRPDKKDSDRGRWYNKGIQGTVVAIVSRQALCRSSTTSLFPHRRSWMAKPSLAITEIQRPRCVRSAIGACRDTPGHDGAAMDPPPNPSPPPHHDHAMETHPP